MKKANAGKGACTSWIGKQNKGEWQSAQTSGPLMPDDVSQLLRCALSRADERQVRYDSSNGDEIWTAPSRLRHWREWPMRDARPSDGR